MNKQIIDLIPPIIYNFVQFQNAPSILQPQSHFKHMSTLTSEDQIQNHSNIQYISQQINLGQIFQKIQESINLIQAINSFNERIEQEKQSKTKKQQIIMLNKQIQELENSQIQEEQ